MRDVNVLVTRDSDFAAFEPHGLRWQHLVFESADASREADAEHDATPGAPPTGE